MLERILSALLGVPFLLGAAAAPDQAGEVLFRFQDPAIVEASALVVTRDGLVITSNDSGDSGRVFAVDHRTGATVGVTHWSDDPTDVEALAPGPRRGYDGSTVWVGDIGDNAASRESVQVALVPVGRGDRTVDPRVYDLAYPDGPHDAETLVRNPVSDRLYIATKGVLGGTLYAAPTRLSADHVNRLTAVGPVLPIATDGAFFGDGKHLIIRNYTAATVYDFPSLQPVSTFPLPAESQGEGLGITSHDQLWLDSEGLHSAVLAVSLPRAVAAVVASGTSSTITELPPTTPTTPTTTASPSRSAGTAATSTADHTTSWAIGAAVLVLGVLVATVGLRRRRR